MRLPILLKVEKLIDKITGISYNLQEFLMLG